MEYKLNKIDTDLRERVRETTYEGKVHRKKDIKIEKDNDKNSENRKFNLPKRNLKKNRIVITAVKKEDNKIDVKAFKENNDNYNIMKGSYIDVRK